MHTGVCIGRVNVWNTLHALRLFSMSGAQSVQKNGYSRHQIKLLRIQTWYKLIIAPKSTINTNQHLQVKPLHQGKDAHAW